MQPVIEAIHEWCGQHLKCGMLTSELVHRQNEHALRILGCVMMDGRSAHALLADSPRLSSFTLTMITITDSQLTIMSFMRNNYRVLNLTDPDSLQETLETIFQIGFDYYRLLYRKAIKKRNRALKAVVSTIAENLRQERRKCRTRNCPLDNNELSTSY